MFYEVPFNLSAEIDEFEDLVEKYRSGALDAASFKARRVPFGCYEQRKDGTFMVRIRTTGGAVTPSQLSAIASLSSQYGADAVHITTRQEFQVHDVALEHVIPIFRGLLTVGLSTRGGGGNTVRNILVSPDAGLNSDEVFDPSPYAFALTTRLIAESDSWNLPRKLKIAFSNSPTDSAFAQFNDIGFIASSRNSEIGFKVYIAGGLGRKPAVGHLLHEFVRTDEIYAVAESVKRIFDRHGNRKNRNAARLRFLWDELGRERFIEIYRAEFDAIAKLAVSHLEPFVPAYTKNELRPEPIVNVSHEYQAWKKRYCREQRQDSLYSVLIPATLGNVGNSDLLALASFLEEVGQDTMRAAFGQNLQLRNIPRDLLGNIYQIVQRISPLHAKPMLLSSSIACTGADTCKLGICLSKGALTAIERKLTASRLDLDLIADFRLHVSGCPNTCGQHMIADLGFYGQAQRKGQRLYPGYRVVAGAVRAEGTARLAAQIDQISARDLPQFVSDVLEHWIAKKQLYASFADYVDEEGAAEIRAICQKYRNVPDFEDDKNYYFDWGSQEVFSLVGRGAGECSAGLFDLIDVDLKLIKQQQQRIARDLTVEDRSDALYRIILSASRMLLVTRGVEAPTDETVFANFIQHFIKAGLVDAVHQQVVDIAREPRRGALTEHQAEVVALADAVHQLYIGMDNSLRFPAEIGADKAVNQPPAVAKERDYRGVTCPMNFVKIKFNLSRMKVGERLLVLLDDGQPIKNVPRSVTHEGHRVLSQTKEGNFWRVEIEKR